jgi:DNA-binding NtrC family response regulator
MQKVLLIEDDLNLGVITAEVLTDIGHESLVANTSSEAFALLQADNRISVILLDLKLGADRGEVLIERLAAARVRIPPIIILSGQPLSELERAAQRVHAAEFIQKPCTAQALNEAIERIAA